MTEKNFSSEITRSLNKNNIWNVKIPDVGVRHKPFDRIIEIDGQMLGIEEKFTKTNVLNFKSKIRPHQMTELMQIKRGYFLINFRIPGKKINESYLINVWRINEMQCAGRKSIDYELCSTVFKLNKVSWDPKTKMWNIVDALRGLMK